MMQLDPTSSNGGPRLLSTRSDGTVDGGLITYKRRKHMQHSAPATSPNRAFPTQMSCLCSMLEDTGDIQLNYWKHVIEVLLPSLGPCEGGLRGCIIALKMRLHMSTFFSYPSLSNAKFCLVHFTKMQYCQMIEKKDYICPGASELWPKQQTPEVIDG